MEQANQTQDETKAASCCSSNVKKKGDGSGIVAAGLSSLIPHAGCIAFIAFSLLGVAAGAAFLKPLMLNGTLFYALIVLSFLATTIAGAFYLKRRQALSPRGIKQSWKYLSLMYSITIGVNLFLFLVAFPAAANAISATPAPATVNQNTQALSAGVNSANQNPVSTTSEVQLRVNIPCSGHASLIIGEIKKLPGIIDVKFSNPNIFTITYDSSKVTAKQITSIDVFNTYAATMMLG